MDIAAAMYKTQHSKTLHPVLTIDGVSLDVWLHRQTHEQDILDLVPAQGWLMDNEDLALAWRRIRPYQENCSTIVPLLICPDDLDLTCTVVVVEQELMHQEILWHRFGMAFDQPGDQVGPSVKWFRNNASARFALGQFQSAIAELQRLTDHEWK